MTINSYLLSPNKRKIFLAEITTDSGTIYLSDSPYITEPGDTPGNQLYYSIIKSVPRLSRKIQELRSGRSMPTYGDLVLSWYRAGSVNLQTTALRGRTVQIYVTGPRKDIARSSAVLIFTGVILGCSGSSDGSITLRVGDKKAQFSQIRMPPNRYDSAVTPSIPAALHGTPKPVCVGTCLNITPKLVDPAGGVYQVNDGVINGVTAVYSNGVALAPGDYTVNATDGTFTLLVGAYGTITADVRGVGAEYGAYDAVSLAIRALAVTYGGLSPSNGFSTNAFDNFPLPTHMSGVFIDQETNLDDVITGICQGVFAWWGFQADGKFDCRVFCPPATVGQPVAVTPVTDKNRLGTVQWEDYPDIVYEQPIVYSLNYTQIGSPAGSVSASYKSWLGSEGYTKTVSDSGIKTAYPDAVVAEKIQSHIHTGSYADDAGAAVLALLGVRRRTLRERTLMTDPPVKLGDTITLSSTDTDNAILNGDYLVMGVTDQWSGEVPTVELELFG